MDANGIELTHTSKTRRGGFFQGCLIVTAVILAIIVGISVFVAYNWRGWVATGVKESTAAILADSSLPQSDKDQITAKVETLASDFESGKLTMMQIGKIAEALVASPILPAAIVSAVEKEYFPKAEFSADEAAAAQRVLQRCARGISEGKINQDRVREILAPIAEVANADQIRLKPATDVSKEQVRRFVDNALAAANDSSVPDEPFAVDFVKEFNELIDRAIADSSAKAP